MNFQPLPLKTTDFPNDNTPLPEEIVIKMFQAYTTIEMQYKNHHDVTY